MERDLESTLSTSVVGMEASVVVNRWLACCKTLHWMTMFSVYFDSFKEFRHRGHAFVHTCAISFPATTAPRRDSSPSLAG